MNGENLVISVMAACVASVLCVLIMSVAACTASTAAARVDGRYLECRPDHDPDIAFRCWERDVGDEP